MQEMLAPERFATDMLNFYKSATLNGWNTLFKAQEQAEKLFTMMYEQNLNAQKALLRDFQTVAFHSAQRNEKDTNVYDFTFTFPLNRKMIQVIRKP